MELHPVQAAWLLHLADFVGEFEGLLVTHVPPLLPQITRIRNRGLRARKTVPLEQNAKEGDGGCLNAAQMEAF